QQTTVQEITEFAKKVYLHKNLNDFKGDPTFIENDNAQKMFSKLRSSVGGIYMWRMEHSKNKTEKDRMARAADFALCQAFALCPYSPEAVYRYVQFLNSQNRVSDSILIASTCAQLDPDNQQVKS